MLKGNKSNTFYTILPLSLPAQKVTPFMAFVGANKYSSAMYRA